MAMEGQTREFRNLAAESAKENSQMNESLKKIINEVQELSDEPTNNDEMDDLFEDNFEASLNVTEEQVRTLTKELGKLEKQYEGNEAILKQIRDLTLLLESKIDGEQRTASFNKFISFIPDKINRLKEDLSRQDKRNIEKFIKGEGNKNAVLETYLKMIGVTNMPDGTTKRDQRIFDEIKTQIESKYNEDERAQRELDNKIFTNNFFATWIEANPDWDGSNVENDAKIKEMNPGPHLFKSEQFKEKFAVKNQERKTNNEAKLSAYPIKDNVPMDKITKTKQADDTRKVEFTKEDGTKVELKKEDFMGTLEITADKVKPGLEGTQFVGNELQTAINGLAETWFNAIKDGATEITEPEPPQVESLEAADIKVNLFNNISADDVKGAVDAAKEHLNAEGLDPADKEKFTARITAVIAALKDGGQELGRGRKPGHENIKQLQETMQQELTLNPRLRPDGKLGRLTFYAMQKYMGVETEKSGDLKYECGHMLGNNLSGMLENFEDQDYLSKALGDNNSDLQGLQDKAENYIRNPLKYVKDRLNDKLGTCNVPGKAILRDILNESPTIKNKIKLLQFALLPDYTGNIDGIIGPATKKALQSYVDKTRTNPGEKIEPLNADRVACNTFNDIKALDASGWSGIDDSTTTYNNAYALIDRKTIKFFDGTTIGNLKTENITKSSTETRENCTTGFIKGKKYVYYGNNLYDRDLNKYEGDDAEAYKNKFVTAETAIAS